MQGKGASDANPKKLLVRKGIEACDYTRLSTLVFVLFRGKVYFESVPGVRVTFDLYAISEDASDAAEALMSSYMLGKIEGLAGASLLLKEAAGGKARKSS